MVDVTLADVSDDHLIFQNLSFEVGLRHYPHSPMRVRVCQPDSLVHRGAVPPLFR
jgi:hypothetical protein